MTADPFDVAGQSVVITGGSRGLGAALVRAFADRGARVAFCHLKDPGGAAHVLMDAKGALIRECDVSDPKDVRRFFAEARQVNGPVDCLITCAGIGDQVAFADMTVDQWDRMIDVHMKGTFLCAQAVFDDMVQRRSGRIIAISSQLAYTGDPGLVHYSAAKAGILGFVRALARAGAPHNVLVNAVAPGAIDTAMTAAHSDDWRAAKTAQIPLGRFALPEEITPTVLMLASAAGGFYSGQTLCPSGGEVML